MNSFTYYIPSRILFGAGMLNKLGTMPLPGKKALIVTTGGTSVKKYGYLDRVIALLAKNGAESVVFDKVLPNPIRAHVMEAAALCRAEGCDFVIGLGGGSPIDSSKSIAIMANNPGDYWDYIPAGSGLGKPIPNPALPIIAITTTAGTGTEADPWTVITHEERNEKIGFGTDDTFPTISIVDPELMLTVPARLTAYQGFDALFHSTEGYLAQIATPISDLFALKSISLISQFLPTAVREGENLEARTQVALANTLSGMVETTSSCISEHSMEHAMSAYFPELPHGAGLIMISAAYYAHFAKTAPQRVANMAAAMGVDTGGMSTEAAAEAFVDALKALQMACGVDTLKMSDYGITEADLPKLVENARYAMGGLFGLDPVALTNDDVLKIYQDSYR
jgi:alcohol dehydrogenase